MDLFTKSWDSCLVTTGSVGTDGKPILVPTLSCLWIVLQNIINAALVLSAVVAVFLIVWSGFQYVTSSGDKEKVDTARKRLTYAIIGLVFIILSFLIVNFIAQFTGVDVKQLTAPPDAQQNLTPNNPTP